MKTLSLILLTLSITLFVIGNVIFFQAIAVVGFLVSITLCIDSFLNKKNLHI